MKAVSWEQRRVLKKRQLKDGLCGPCDIRQNQQGFEGSLSDVGREDVRMAGNERPLGLESHGEQGAHDISELEIIGIAQ